MAITHKETKEELQTTIQPETRLAQYIGGETGVQHEPLMRHEWLRADAGNETI